MAAKAPNAYARAKQAPFAYGCWFANRHLPLPQTGPASTAIAATRQAEHAPRIRHTAKAPYTRPHSQQQSAGANRPTSVSSSHKLIATLCLQR
ncbi:hypothetical protein NPIL_403311 [Nephila pilipes]|uniref:Uncharacterized protein n=1 Tax=Nephila pilipes TaxID=299642 RepID=A0A8X6N1W2_NEPPI|nr:hypothetical protein NPIL_403311 [Nephila pilipes]